MVLLLLLLLLLRRGDKSFVTTPPPRSALFVPLSAMSFCFNISLSAAALKLGHLNLTQYLV